MTLSCPHFGICGGCQNLTTPTDQQRAEKIDRVTQVLGSHLPDAPLTFTDTPDRPPRHDRLRILYPVQPDAQGRVTMGLYRRGTHDAIRIESCELQHQALTTVGRRAEGIFRTHGLRPYEESRHDGDVRAFSARLAASTGELLLGIVTTAAHPGLRAVAAELHKAATGLPVARGRTTRVVGVVQNIHPDRGNVLVGRDTRPLLGRDHLFDKVDGLTFRVGFESFYQLHRRADALLYRPSLDMLGPFLPGATVVDAFGGVGTFALRCLRRGASAVTLVEASPPACADARHNASANDLQLEVREARLADAALERPDILIVDPNRAGLQAAGCAEVERLAPPHLLYVACGLEALGRDLERLPGYNVLAVRLADLFPHTPHVETIALCERVL